MDNVLFLRLEGPLQAWGEDSQWSERRTMLEPTKSGVVGLLACTLGWSDDPRIRALSQRVRVGVRVDAPGAPAPLRDYHTIGGGATMPQLLTGRGDRKETPGGQPHTEETWRSYLSDASFLAAVMADPPLIRELAGAVQGPRWVWYLGRKSCVPTRPLFDGVGEFPTLEAALEDHPVLLVGDSPQLEEHPRIVVETGPGAGAVRHRTALVSRAFWIHEPVYTRTYRMRGELRVEHLDTGGE